MYRKSEKLQFRILLITLLVMAICSTTLFAATTGKIAGVVKSKETGDALANAKVTIVGTQKLTVTNRQGYFVFTNVSPGNYDIEVELVGYQTVRQEGAKISVGLTTTVDFTLAEAPIEIEGLTVTAVKPLIKADVTQTTKIIDADEIEEMPRDTVGGIISTQAGTTVDNETGAIHVRGGRDMEIKYLLDGIPIDDPIFRGMGLRINPESLAQMEMITGGFNAEYGDAQSGIINLVSKEGGPKFKGRFTYRYGMWSQHDNVDPFYISWQDPDNDYRPHVLEPFEGIFVGKPYDYQKPYRGQSDTIKELAEREDDPVVFTEILPGVWADRTENPEFTKMDPETGEPILDDEGNPVMERRPYTTSDGLKIDYESKTVTLVDGYKVDLQQYSDLLNNVDGIDTNSYNLDPTHLGEFSLSGPIVGNKVTFSLSGERRRNRGYIPGAFTDRYGLQGKLKFELTPSIKLTTSGAFDWRESTSAGNTYRFNPNMLSETQSNGSTFAARLTHELTSATFYSLTVGRFNNLRSSRQKNKLWDPLSKTFSENAWDPEKSHEENVAEGRVRNPRQQAYNDSTYFIAGDNNDWQDRRSSVLTLKGDFTSQINANHQIKSGLEYSGQKMQYLGTRNFGESNMYVEYYDIKPIGVSGYVQDKMEFAGMIVNAGLRYDLYKPEGEFPTDPLDPLVLNDDGTIKRAEVDLTEDFVRFAFRDQIEEAADESKFVEDHLKAEFPVKKNAKSPSTKHMIGPRLGISYPITERDKFHFTYGHYYQMPEGDDLYENSMFDMRGAIRRMGNPDLEPEKTIAYEVSLEHQFTDDLTFGVTGFQKDIDKLIDSVIADIGGNTYYYFINGVYGRAKGVELVLRKWQTEEGLLSGTLSYTYSIAMGKGSSRNLGYLTSYYSQAEVTESHPLDWDQRHVLSGLLNVKLPMGLSIYGIGKYASGLPYTPDSRLPGKPDVNSKRYPSTHNVDMIINWKLSAVSENVPLVLFADIRNVFNTQNLHDIIDSNMYERYGKPMSGQKRTNPFAWSSPRQIMLGLTIDW